MNVLRHLLRPLTWWRKSRGRPGPALQETTDRNAAIGASPENDAQQMREEVAREPSASSCASAECEACACREVNHTADELLRRLSETGRLSPGERQALIDSLIAAVDIADLALGAGDGSVPQESPLRGLLLMRSKLLAALSGLGVSRAGNPGSPVDLASQEVALVTDTEDQDLDGRVASVIRSGYRTSETIIRQALVRVYRSRAGLAKHEGVQHHGESEEA